MPCESYKPFCDFQRSIIRDRNGDYCSSRNWRAYCIGETIVIGNRDRYACQDFLREINKFLYEQRREDVHNLAGV